MVEAKEEKKTSKIKKKRWYQIFAPSLLKDTLLGETLLTDSSALVGKTVTVNLMGLINDVRKQNINVKFLINQVQGDRALTEITGYEIIPASLKRLIRKGKKRVDISFVCKTSDNKKIRVKPLLLIKTSTKGSTEYALRKESIEFLTGAIAKTSYDNLVMGLISYKIQGALRGHLKKVYPLRVCEIRYMAIEREKKPIEGKEAEATEEPEDKKEIKVEKKEETKAEKKEEKTEEVKEKPAELKEEKKEVKVEAKKPEAEASS